MLIPAGSPVRERTGSAGEKRFLLSSAGDVRDGTRSVFVSSSGDTAGPASLYPLCP